MFCDHTYACSCTRSADRQEKDEEHGQGHWYWEHAGYCGDRVQGQGRMVRTWGKLILLNYRILQLGLCNCPYLPFSRHNIRRCCNVINKYMSGLVWFGWVWFSLVNPQTNKQSKKIIQFLWFNLWVHPNILWTRKEKKQTNKSYLYIF